MGVYMEKELFYMLQNIKRDINCLDLKYLKEKLEDLNYKCMHEENNFDYYNKLYLKNNIKLLFIKMIPFIDKKTFYNYISKKNKLDLLMDEIEEKYNMLLIETVVTEVLLDINTNKEVVLKNNYNQIDTFLSFINQLTNEEKNKIFSYKMGVNNE